MINRKILAIIIITFVTILFVLFKNRDHRVNEYEIELTYLPPKPFKSNKLFNIDFEYIIDNTVCGDETKNNSNILAVILVTSYFGNVETRSAMRRAFPHQILEEFNLRRIFLLGVEADDKYTTQRAILDENKRFGDIIQGNFKEAYRNLTYKHMMGIKWAAEHCRQAKFVIKMDDDIVVNFYKIVELLKTAKLPRKLLAGYVLRGLTPIREPANKWYVTREEYGASSYPTFASGWFYITTPKVCQKFVELSSTTPYFWVDDVYVTGILAQKLKLIHYSLQEYFTVHPEYLQCCMRDIEKFKYDCEVFVGPNGGNNNLFFEFNELTSRCFYEECLKRTKPLNQTCIAEKKYSLGRGEGLIKTYRLS